MVHILPVHCSGSQLIHQQWFVLLEILENGSSPEVFLLT